jgi:hypothetical protein
MATNRAMLKEAIADAKAVKETAIANAKAALEEAFTPQLKSMLSMKLQEMDLEEEDLEETYMSEKKDEDLEEMHGKKEDDMMEEVDLEELLAELEEDEMEEGLYEAEETEEEDMEMSDEETEETEDEAEPIDLEDMTDEDLKTMIEDVIADMIKSGELEGGNTEEEESEEVEDEEVEDEEDVDLAELLREIEEMEGGYGLEEDSISEGKVPSKEELEAKLTTLTPEEEKMLFKAIQDVNASTLSEEENGAEKEIETVKQKVARIAQTVGLSTSVLGTISFIAGVINDSGAAKAAKMAQTIPMDALAAAGGVGILMGLATAMYGYLNKKMEESRHDELKEAYSTIETLKSELNEINLLNAKLLYTNKIFKSKTLNESQKVKVLSSFDKAKNVGEVKMVFETLNEGIKVSKNTINENLGRASKGTIAPNVKKPIVESNEAFLRMQKLAGII